MITKRKFITINRINTLHTEILKINFHLVEQFIYHVQGAHKENIINIIIILFMFKMENS
jgi:hypothetical protein